MIITLTQANFSSCNIGTLTTVNVRISSVTGTCANVTLLKNSVEKSESTTTTIPIATITLDETNYKDHNVTVKMGSTDVTNTWYSGGSVTIPVNASITSNITISVSATAVGGGSTGSTGSTGGNTEPDTPTNTFTYTVNATPKVAAVTLSAPGYTQSGNTITVPSGTSVSWTVESLGYTKQEGIETITGDKSSDIELTSADATQPVLTVYSIPSGKTIWTPSGGAKISSNETGTFVGEKIGMKCYWGVTKDGYEPQGDVAQLNSNINKEVTLNAVPIVEVERVLALDTDMIRKTGYFIGSTGAWNGYYSNFCFHQIPVQPGQSYRITTSTGQNAWPALFCASTLDLSSIDTTSQPAGNTLTKYTVKSSKKYGGPPALGTYVVTVPEGTTCMLVNSGTASSALNAFKVELLK